MNGRDKQAQFLKIDWADSAWFRILLVTALALGVFFRLSGLGNKIYSHDEIYTSLYSIGHRGGDVFTSLWDGNTKTVDDIREFIKPNKDRKVSEILSMMAIYSPHQAPIFFVLEHYWMKLIGYSPAEMRTLSAIFSLISIFAIYWLGKELFRSSSVALIAMVFFAISPYHILFAQDARPYGLLALITTLSSAALLRAMRWENRRNWILYSFTLTLGVYSHQIFILVAIAHGLYFLIMYLSKIQKGFCGFIWAGVIAFLMYLPWLLFVINRLQVVTRQTEVLSMQVIWYRYFQRWILLFSTPLIDIDLNSDTANLVPYFLRVLLLAFIAYGVLYLLKRGSQREKLFLLLIYLVTSGTFIALDMIFGGIRSITGRYFVPANIATIMVLAWFLAEKLDHAQGKAFTKWKYVLISLMLVGILSNINSLFAKTWWNKELGRVNLEFINEINKDQTLLIVSGSHPTNLGDVLMLGFEIDQDVQFRLYRDAADIDFPQTFQRIYWFPSMRSEILSVSANKQIEVKEVLGGTLWKIIEK